MIANLSPPTSRSAATKTSSSRHSPRSAFSANLILRSLVETDFPEDLSQSSLTQRFITAGSRLRPICSSRQNISTLYLSICLGRVLFYLATISRLFLKQHISVAEHLSPTHPHTSSDHIARAAAQICPSQRQIVSRHYT